MPTLGAEPTEADRESSVYEIDPFGAGDLDVRLWYGSLDIVPAEPTEEATEVHFDTFNKLADNPPAGKACRVVSAPAAVPVSPHWVVPPKAGTETTEALVGAVEPAPDASSDSVRAMPDLL